MTFQPGDYVYVPAVVETLFVSKDPEIGECATVKFYHRGGLYGEHITTTMPICAAHLVPRDEGE